MSFEFIEENYYCPTCGTTNDSGKECCGINMVEKSEVEGFGISDFEPAGSGGYDLIDEWN